MKFAEGNYYNIYSVSDSLEARAYSAGVVGSLPLGEHFSLFAKLGVGVVSQKYHCNDAFCANLPDKTTDSTVMTGAIGARWHASKHFALRAAYEHFGGARYRIERSDGEKFSKNADYGLFYAAAELSF